MRTNKFRDNFTGIIHLTKRMCQPTGQSRNVKNNQTTTEIFQSVVKTKHKAVLRLTLVALLTLYQQVVDKSYFASSSSSSLSYSIELH